jgi:hypothetical protein
MGTPRHPSLYQINTRVWLTALARSLAGPPRWTTSRTASSTAWPVWDSTGSGF